jgi:hypothetical protein
MKRLITAVAFAAGVLLAQRLAASEKPAVVLLPVDNLAGAPDAAKLVRAELVARLEARGWQVADESLVEPVLERNRVRYMDSLTSRVRRELVEATNASAVMVTSVTAYRGGEAAVVTLSGRLIAANGAILWSNIGGARDEQTEPLFGGAKRTGPSDVSANAVDVLTDELPAPGEKVSQALPGGGFFSKRRPASFVARELVRERKPRICVLPFDSNSLVPEAAFVMANAFALRLAAAGHFEVVEPADLRAASVAAGIGSFRSLGSDELAKLGKLVGTTVFLRGNISRYIDGGTRLGSAVPSVELELFLIDVAAGKVLWSASHARSGSDYAGLLLLGGVYDAATLTDRVVCELALDERRGVARNTEWAAAHPQPRKLERRQLLATTARKER